MSKKRVLGKLSKISFGTFAFHPNVWHHLPRDSQKSRPVMCDKLEKKKKQLKYIYSEPYYFGAFNSLANNE